MASALPKSEARLFLVMGVAALICGSHAAVAELEFPTRLAQARPAAPADPWSTPGASPAPSSQKAPAPAPSKPATVRPAAAAPKPAGILVDGNVGNLSPSNAPEPLQHARNGGLARCLGAVEQSATVIGAPHSSFSRWNRGAPDGYAFQAIAVEAYPGSQAPRAASVMLATPAAIGCDAITVQVFPTTRSCSDVAKDVAAAGPLMGMLAGLPLYQGGPNGQRLLMPSAGGGCVILAVAVQNVPPPTAPPNAPVEPQATPTVPRPPPAPPSATSR